MRKSQIPLYLLSRKHLFICAACTLPLLAYVVVRGILAPNSEPLTIARMIVVLTGGLAIGALIRALSSRIPQMGAPYYSDDGTLSALSEKSPRDLSIPWGEIAIISIEFLIFAGAWIIVFAVKTK
jgi:hypothetical protein